MRYEVNAVMDMELEARALGQGVWEMRWLEVWWQEKGSSGTPGVILALSA